VLKGELLRAIGPDSIPEVIPLLQKIGVASIHRADYHTMALTTDGHLFTWGSWLRGGLGLGDPRHLPIGTPGGYASEEMWGRHFWWTSPPEVRVPTEVKFPPGKIVVACAAGGWHSAALVVDVGEYEPENDKDRD
jgi:SCF-associated factor 1